MDLLVPWLEDHPDDVDAWVALGGAHFAMEDWQASARAARRAARLRPENPRHWSNLGTSLRKAGHLSSAEDAQHRALALKENYHRAEVELRKIEQAREAGVTDLNGGDGGNGRGAIRGGRADERVNWRRTVRMVAVGFAVAILAVIAIDALVGWTRGTLNGPDGLHLPGVSAARQAHTSEADRRRRIAYEMDQQMRRNTIGYVDSQTSPGCHPERTQAQREAIWQKLQGQWVRWEGTVREVAAGDERCEVAMCCRPGTSEADTFFELDRDAALMLNRGQRIRIEGQLAEQEGEGYELEDVRVVARW